MGERLNHGLGGVNFALTASSAYIMVMADAASPILHASPPTAEQELSILTEVGQILSSTLELRDTFGRMMQIISDKLNMRRGTLVLLDESTGRLRTEAAVGLTSDEMERGKSVDLGGRRII